MLFAVTGENLQKILLKNFLICATPQQPLFVLIFRAHADIHTLYVHVHGPLLACRIEMRQAHVLIY